MSRIRLAAMRSRLALSGFLALVLIPPPLNGQHGSSRQPTSAVAEQLFAQAEQLLEKGSVEAARQKVNEGLKVDPASARGNNVLGLVYEAEHQFALAIAAFHKALRIAPNAAEVYTNLGNTYFSQKKLDLAETQFRAALRLHPTDRNANYSLGVVLLKGKRPKEAIHYFQAVQPADATSLFNLVQAYLQVGATEQGLAAAEQLSTMAKDDVRVHFTLGVALAANKQYAAGVRELEAADALEPGTFEILHNLGQAYRQNGQNDKAQTALSRALQLQPESAETLYFLAETYHDQNKDLNALELLTQAHKLSPRNTDVILLLARLMMKQAYYEDATLLLENGVKITPNRPDLHAALGECYFSGGKIKKAILEFEKLLTFDRSAGSYAFLALCYRHLGQFDQAKKYLSEGLKADPHNPACLFNMGYIAGREGHSKEAEAWLEKAVAYDPNYADALFELASAKMQEGKFADAIPLLQKCADLDPHRAPVYYKLATAERNLHQMAAAERDLKVFETLSRNPAPGPYPYRHLFDYLDKRAGLPLEEQTELDLKQLQEEIKQNPGQPHDLYLLADAYLRLGRIEDAEQAIGQLDQISQRDLRTEVGVGVLLARYGLYPQAIAHFKEALEADSSSADAAYDLADAYFRAGDYQNARAALQHISQNGQKDSSYLSLLGDIEAHLGHTSEAIRSFREVIAENPYRDETYLSLALTYLRSENPSLARQVLTEGLARTPNSGWLFWGMGVLTAAEGNLQEAEEHLQKAVELLPQWAGSYATLGVLYYETGQIEKAKGVLKEFTAKGPQGALNIQGIEQTLDASSGERSGAASSLTMSPQARQQFLTLVLAFADQGR